MNAITIIVPLYNSADTLDATVASIRDQTFTNYDVILVDDASQDESYVRACKACAGGENWQLIRLPENRGPAGARNAGIATASGAWLAFLDADDAWHPRKLELQMTWLTETDQCFCSTGSHDLSDASSGELEAWRRRSFADPLPVCELSLESFLDNNAVVTSSVVVKRAVVEQAGLFDKQFRGPEDLDLWLRIAAEHRLAIMDLPLVNYQQRIGSLSMDERRFVPEIERVWKKAFREGGVFSDRPELLNTALSTQYVNAAWMAFCRGARGTAVRHLVRACVFNRHAVRPVRRPWCRLLWRYTLGKRPIWETKH